MREKHDRGIERKVRKNERRKDKTVIKTDETKKSSTCDCVTARVESAVFIRMPIGIEGVPCTCQKYNICSVLLCCKIQDLNVYVVSPCTCPLDHHTAPPSQSY